MRRSGRVKRILVKKVVGEVPTKSAESTHGIRAYFMYDGAQSRLRWKLQRGFFYRTII